jgi:hypothetical protein
MGIVVKSLLGGVKDMIMKPNGTVFINPFITSILIVGFILFLLFLFSEDDNLMLKVGVWGGIFTTIVLFYHNKAIKTEIENKNEFTEPISTGDEGIALQKLIPEVKVGGIHGSNGGIPLLPKLSCVNH